MEQNNQRRDLINRFTSLSTHVRPGKYVVFAAREEDLDVWDDEDFIKLLRSDTTESNLHENENQSAN